MVYGLWDDDPLPEYYKMNIFQWVKQGFFVKVWNRTEVEDLFKQYPMWDDLYHRLPLPIMKADLARLLIIYDQGGTYMDLDAFPYDNNLFQFLQQDSIQELFFLESENTNEYARSTAKTIHIRKGVPEKPKRYANFAFFALPHNKHILHLLHFVKKRFDSLEDYTFTIDYDVLYTTGPDTVTEMVYELKPRTIPHHYFIYHQTTASWRL